MLLLLLVFVIIIIIIFKITKNIINIKEYY